jgi:hypothetical protein
MTHVHLRDKEIVDLLDGALDAVRTEHARGCDACRARVDALSAVLGTVKEVELPEPSPLFWDQLSSRVRAAVAAEPQPRRSVWPWLQLPTVRWAAPSAAALLVVGVGLWSLASRYQVSPAPGPMAIVHNPADDTHYDDDVFVDIESDEAWGLVRSVAEDLPPDDIDAAGVGVRPGSAEGVVFRLSDAERSELARLLEEAIKSPPSESSL